MNVITKGSGVRTVEGSGEETVMRWEKSRAGQYLPNRRNKETEEPGGPGKASHTLDNFQIAIQVFRNQKLNV